MSRSRTSSARPWVGSFALRWCIAAAAFVALLLVGGRGHAAALTVREASGAAVLGGSTHDVAEAVPPRLEPQIRRDRAWRHDPVQPFSDSVRAWQRVVSRYDSHAVGAGYDFPRDRRVSHFRRRIPRMNSEEPPRA